MVWFGLALLLPLLVNGAAVYLEPRQDAGAAQAASLMNGKMEKMKALKVEDIPAKSKVAGAKRIKLVYGPYKLKGANNPNKVGNGVSMDKGGTSYQYLVDDDFPKDITVLQATSEIQTKDFKRATTAMGIYNHHNIFMDISKPLRPAYGCSTGTAPKTNSAMSILAAGATESGGLDFAAVDSEIKTGYYLKQNRVVMNMIDTINYNNEEVEVYTSTELEYLPGKPAGYLDTNQHLIEPGICGGPNGAYIHPPQGVTKFSVNSTGIIVNEDGYIVNLRGHMHDGGINIFLQINGKEVCNSKATYGGEGHTTVVDGKVWETIAESSTCSEPIKVKKGDQVYMQANYDTELHPSRHQGGGHGGMPMKWLNNVRTTMNGMDGGEDAEQMALMVTYFASEK